MPYDMDTANASALDLREAMTMRQGVKAKGVDMW
jgi:hypothetical protein